MTTVQNLEAYIDKLNKRDKRESCNEHHTITMRGPKGFGRVVFVLFVTYFSRGSASPEHVRQRS